MSSLVSFGMGIYHYVTRTQMARDETGKAESRKVGVRAFIRPPSASAWDTTRVRKRGTSAFVVP
jgi:hypothetical protein